ncbi:serine hydrolase [bacterium]|nr:serine hydrolase [bacterium]
MIIKIDNKNVEIGGEAGKFAFAVKNFTTGETFFYNEAEKFHSASMIKLPILSFLYLEAENGNVDLEAKYELKKEDVVEGGIIPEFHLGSVFTLRDLANIMIVVSDNTATNILIDFLGFEKINRHIKEYLGMEKTELTKKLMIPAKSPDIFNYTCAEDILHFFELLYFGKLVSKRASKEMLETLSRQMFIEKIPRFLPDCAFTANKTGEVSGTRHDGAIVKTDDFDFGICVLTSESDDVNKADDFISYLSRYFFDLFSQKE